MTIPVLTDYRLQRRPQCLRASTVRSFAFGESMLIQRSTCRTLSSKFPATSCAKSKPPRTATVRAIAKNICRIGPGWFIPATSLAFGICSLGTAFVNTYSQICAVRFLLGIFEAGMLPGIAYYLSRWYRRSELAFRLSLYIVMAPLAGAFGGLLASGILTLSSVGSLTTWRMIFIIEGVITCGLALISFVTLTDRPSTARWLSAEERELAINRVKSERVGATEVLDKMDTKKLLAGIFNPVTLGTSSIFLLNNVTVQGLAFFLPTIVRVRDRRERLGSSLRTL